MSKAKAEKFLPKPEALALVQIRVSPELLERVNTERKRLDVTWKDLFEAMMKQFLAERGK